MPHITPKIELLVDLSKPAIDEITGCIAAIVNSYHGKQLEILQQVDVWLGEQITKLEENAAKEKEK